MARIAAGAGRRFCTASLKSALRLIPILKRSNRAKEVCYHWGMWELLLLLFELLWYAYLIAFPTIFVSWITYKVLSWFFP